MPNVNLTASLHIDADTPVSAHDLSAKSGTELACLYFGDFGATSVCMLGDLHNIELALGKALAELDRIRAVRNAAEDRAEHSVMDVLIAELAKADPPTCEVCGAWDDECQPSYDGHAFKPVPS